MIHFTKYAEEKFEILNEHKIFFTREQIENTVKTPDELEKKDGYFSAKKDGVGVIYQKSDGLIKIITFFPIKEK